MFCTALHNTKLQTLLSLNFSALKRAELRCMLKCSVEHPLSRFPFAVKGRSVKKKPNVPASSQAGLAQVDMAFHGRGSGPVGKPSERMVMAIETPLVMAGYA